MNKMDTGIRLHSTNQQIKISYHLLPKTVKPARSVKRKKNLTRTTSEIFRAKHGLLKELVSTKQNS